MSINHSLAKGTPECTAVDMGLSVLWASYNIGAEELTGLGAYFAWGETREKEVFDWASYRWIAPATAPDSASVWPSISKYQVADGHEAASWYAPDGRFVGDNRRTLEREDDAASANWHEGWRTPTIEEWNELADVKNCSWQWIENHEGKNVNGYLVTSRLTGASIFLPAAGSRWDRETDGVGTDGYYWAADLNTGHVAYARNYFFFYSDCRFSTNDNRYYGFSVRAVRAR